MAGWYRSHFGVERPTVVMQPSGRQASTASVFITGGVVAVGVFAAGYYFGRKSREPELQANAAHFEGMRAALLRERSPFETTSTDAFFSRLRDAAHHTSEGRGQ